MKFSNAIAIYLGHKRALGYKFINEEFIILAFLKRTGNVPINSIDENEVLSYLNTSGIITDTWFKKHRTLEKLFQFFLTRKLIKVSPVTCSVPKKNASNFVPYIYSIAELRSLLNAIPATCGNRVPIDPSVLHTLILLLYGTGLRLGEALRLTMGKIDLKKRHLHIHDTKFFKDRLVPIGSDLTKILIKYVRKHHTFHDIAESSPLFCFNDGSYLSQSAARNAFRRMRLHAGIQREGGTRYQPRLHDIRHTFAVHRLIAWYRSNANLQELLPKLAIYMGHVNLSSTQHYLTMTPELLNQASLRFERYVKGESL